MGWIPGSGRSPGEGHSNPVQYSCRKNPLDRGAWWATVHRVTTTQTQLKWLRARDSVFHCVNLIRSLNLVEPCKAAMIGLSHRAVMKVKCMRSTSHCAQPQVGVLSYHCPLLNFSCLTVYQNAVGITTIASVLTISIQRNLFLIKNYHLVRTIANQPYLDLSVRRLGLLLALFYQHPEQEAGKNWSNKHTTQR